MLFWYNKYTEFLDSVIKLTPVTRKLFSSTWWVSRGHCMKKVVSIWSLWSPLDWKHFDNFFGAETFSKPISISQKNSGENTINCCLSTCILLSFWSEFMSLLSYEAIYFAVLLGLIHVYCYLLSWQETEIFLTICISLHRRPVAF